MSFYRRNLPHWQPEGAEYFVTFRLDETLPRAIIKDLKEKRANVSRTRADQCSSGCQPELRRQLQRKIFQKYERHLDYGERGPLWLQRPEIAEIVSEAIHYRDKREYELYAYCIMPNHVHLVFKHIIQENTGEENRYPISDILMSLKRFTARECNKMLDRSGSFWQDESFDRVIRDAEELERTIAYTLNNPVKADLVDYWEEWPYSYCKPDFLPNFQS